MVGHQESGKYIFPRNKTWTLKILLSHESSWKESHSKGAPGRAREPNRMIHNTVPGLCRNHKQLDSEALSGQRIAMKGSPNAPHQGWTCTWMSGTRCQWQVTPLLAKDCALFLQLSMVDIGMPGHRTKDLSGGLISAESHLLKATLPSWGGQHAMADRCGRIKAWFPGHTWDNSEGSS